MNLKIIFYHLYFWLYLSECILFLNPEEVDEAKVVIGVGVNLFSMPFNIY